MQRARRHLDSCSKRVNALRAGAKRQSRVRRVLRFAVACFVALCLMAEAAVPQPNFDCGKAYKAFWENLDRETYAKMPPAQLVVLSRRALRIYDACQTGDLEDAKGLFERLVRFAK